MKTEKFVWLFYQFRRSTFDRPLQFITDQDATICKAVELVFPQSRYRYCIWHVRKHKLEHFQGYRSHYPNVNEAYQRWVLSDAPVKFEVGWQHISQEFNVEPRSGCAGCTINVDIGFGVTWMTHFELV